MSYLIAAPDTLAAAADVAGIGSSLSAAGRTRAVVVGAVEMGNWFGNEDELRSRQKCTRQRKSLK
jgi:hypothetical protein